MKKKHCIISCIIFLLAATNVALGQSAFDNKLKSLYRNTVPFIRADVLQRRLLSNERVTLLDTRALDEFDVSHLKGAVLIDYRNFTIRQLDTLSRDTPIVVYCSVGYRSERIGEKLIAAGFTDVANLYGGIFEWVNNGYLVVDKNEKTTLQVHTYNKSWSQWLMKGVKVY